jgi:hypothetical protein
MKKGRFPVKSEIQIAVIDVNDQDNRDPSMKPLCMPLFALLNAPPGHPHFASSNPGNVLAGRRMSSFW